MISIYVGDFKESNIYKILMAEREEIQKLKWLESEKRGYDIGIYKAIHLWVIFHKNAWMKEKLNRLD